MPEILDGGNAYSFPSNYKWTFENYWQTTATVVTFHHTGSAQTLVIPSDATSLATVRLRGGNGGSTSAPLSGGYVSGDLIVTPGETLTINVAGDGGAPSGATGGTGGSNGGGNGGNGSSGRSGGPGGGGATDIRQGGTGLADRVAVAGGSAGDGFPPPARAGVGGGVTGGDGGHTSLYTGSGLGGTQSAGGAAGTVGATAGSLGTGGNGANWDGTHASDGGAGGGAGYYGGGGGGLSDGPTHTGPYNGMAGGGGPNFAGGLSGTIVNSQGVDGYHEPIAEITYGKITERYVWEVNPNAGGSPLVEKSLAVTQNIGPNRVGIVQEGQNKPPTLQFGGVILSQSHYETLERWFDKRVLIRLTDDLGRQFYGVFSKFTPKRERRVHHPWYHTYDAEFTVSAYVSASGENIYGRAG